MKDLDVPLTRVDGGCEGYVSALAEGAAEFIQGSRVRSARVCSSA